MSKRKIRNSIKKMSTGRKLLLALAALLLLAGALAGGAYLYFSLPDARVYRELDEDFGREFFEIFLLDLETAPDLLPSEPGEEEERETPAPDDDPAENNTDPAENDTDPAESAPDSASTSDRRHGTAEKSSPAGPETAGRSKEEIVQIYSRKIRTL